MLLVHVDRPMARAHYAIEHVLTHMLGWPVRFATSVEEFRAAEGPRLSYGSEPVAAAAVHVHASGWLEEKGIKAFEPPVGREDDLLVLFPSDHGHDIFAATFYLLSRFEEYAKRDQDAHGRLPSKAHFVVRHGVEWIPIVDHWAIRLGNQLRKVFPSLPPTARNYSHTVTVDVDNGLKYLGRPLWKQYGAAFRDLLKGRPAVAGDRLKVLSEGKGDPFDIYGSLEESVHKAGVQCLIAFFLVKGNGRYDHAADLEHATMKKGIRALARSARIGIHPSYSSSDDPGAIPFEIQRLSQVAGARINLSRQHFLRWRMPDTLRALEQAGINEEHSLGFSDRPGFRAGTCTPFKWYDLEQERVSDLVLHPFAVMDSALHDRMGLDPQKAVNEFMRMSDAARQVHGSFTSVWHDRFLSGHGNWKGWPAAFQQVITRATP